MDLVEHTFGCFSLSTILTIEFDVESSNPELTYFRNYTFNILNVKAVWAEENIKQSAAIMSKLRYQFSSAGEQCCQVGT